MRQAGRGYCFHPVYVPWPGLLGTESFLCAVGLPVRIRMFVPFPSDMGMARTKQGTA